MPVSGYFGIQDAIIIILSASMGFSLIRRNPDDPTRWIPVNNLTFARWIVGVAVVVVSSITIGRIESALDYAVSFAGAILFLAGAVFFYGAKSPMSSILVEDENYGVSLRPKGFYRFVRHPLYFGLFLCAAGFPLYLVSIPGLVVSFAVALPVLLYSSKTLDAHWTRRAGEGYELYCASVRQFLPSVKSSWKKENAVKRI